MSEMTAHYGPSHLEIRRDGKSMEWWEKKSSGPRFVVTYNPAAREYEAIWRDEGHYVGDEETGAPFPPEELEFRERATSKTLTLAIARVHLWMAEINEELEAFESETLASIAARDAMDGYVAAAHQRNPPVKPYNWEK